MTNDIIILGSTGSVGNSTLSVLKGSKNFKIKLLSTNKNIKKLFNQAVKFKVKNVVVEDEILFVKYKSIFKKKKITLHHGINNIDKILKKKVNFCINSISGIDGLEPTLKVIPKTQNLLIANKESIICAWEIIKKKLIKYKTNFIPIDSEHFSIWKLMKNENFRDINKIILTASGGPFLKTKKKKLKNIKPKFALNHPNWKMGKKISIDSSTMMNKIFEFIEAKKIFNLKKKELSILIHPSSFVHAIVFFKNDLIKLLAHNTEMTIPISNALGILKKNSKIYTKRNVEKLNNLKFINPSKKQFPLLKLLDIIPEKYSFFETVLITINDNLVHRYLNGQINYSSIHSNILNIIKKPYFKKYYKLEPKNIYDIKKIIKITKTYLDNNIKKYNV